MRGSGFAGYAWYDRLPRVTAIFFLLELDGETRRYGEEHLLPDTLESGVAASITAQIACAASGAPDAATECIALPLDMLVCANDGYDLDEALIFVAGHGNATPSDLARLIDASLFCPCDDHDSDSWETQHDDFQTRARETATRLLLGDEAALIERVADAARSSLLWLLPAGRKLTLTALDRDLAITLDPAAPA